MTVIGADQIGSQTRTPKLSVQLAGFASEKAAIAGPRPMKKRSGPTAGLVGVGIVDVLKSSSAFQPPVPPVASTNTKDATAKLATWAHVPTSLVPRSITVSVGCATVPIDAPVALSKTWSALDRIALTPGSGTYTLVPTTVGGPVEYPLCSAKRSLLQRVAPSVGDRSVTLPASG